MSNGETYEKQNKDKLKQGYGRYGDNGIWGYSKRAAQ